MYLKEGVFFRNTQWPIIGPDCKSNLVIVLLKGKGENMVQLNGKTIFTGPRGFSKIRFRTEHFCLFNHTTLSFYTLTGEFDFNCEVGNDIFELFPYRQGVLCIYGDEGVVGKKLGKNRLNYATSFQQPESYYVIAFALTYEFGVFLEENKL